MTPRMTTAVSKVAANQPAQDEFTQGHVTSTGLGNDIRVLADGQDMAPDLATTEPLFAGGVVWVRRARRGPPILVGTSDG